ncbi:serine/threonine-protein kinase [Spirosoma endbachense]|uniref:Protein kinase n=1 Tax=Spirosoma endbachense TaxID=2666025 RepID=A0A6P1VMU8_9BACT|nr:serine/threonine-protein kinase [Spirosoma endbachense]QHV94025.1 protein kinase [Spirosoma endbachense]
MSQSFTSFLDFKRRYPIRPNDEGSLLGSGSYGRVIKVEDQLETEWVAIKISEYKGNDTKSLKAEVELAQRIPRQGNIARYDACYRLETDTSVSDFAIMKYYPDGNLADLLRRINLTAPQIYDITRGILLGLQHLHRHRIVHRDFKPANILISRDNAGRFIPKIADFGLSKLVSDDELDSSDFDLSDGRGTPSYKAPEQIEGSRVSFNLDLWAFGVILFEMLTGEKPFRSDLRNSSEQSVRREIEKKIITVELPSQLNQIEEPYQAMIRRCLVRDIHDRVRKEDELLDLLDRIPQLLSEAKKLISQNEFEQARLRYEQILAKREHHIDAQKGLEFCKLRITNQQIDNLLAQAGTFVTQQQFEQAKLYYEQVLRLSPNRQEAAQGLVLCIEQLRPKPVAIQKVELTDVFQEERTDVYTTPLVALHPSSADQKQPDSVKVALEKKNTDRPTALKTAIYQDIVESSTISDSEKRFPWRVVAPVVIAMTLGGSILYYVSLHIDQKPDISTATVVPLTKTRPPESAHRENTARLPIAGDTKNSAVDQQVDFAFKNARQAFRQKDYKKVIEFTTPALRLDPTRQDVSRLHRIALKEIDELTPEKPKENDKTNGQENSPVLEPSKPTVVEAPKESAPDNTVNPKLAAQEKYDQLIEDGQKAISRGNNKAKAIADFTAARALAKEHELNTAKADAAYSTYMNKGNKIFDNEEYDGAKEWYKVAQALKETRDVQSKIKLCTNQ